MYRCAACGGRYAVTSDALDPIERGQWDPAELRASVRQSISEGVLPRIEKVADQPRVLAVGRQAS